MPPKSLLLMGSNQGHDVQTRSLLQINEPQYRKALRVLSIGFSPLSVLWKVQATRHDKRRDQQQHADADRLSNVCSPEAYYMLVTERCARAIHTCVAARHFPFRGKPKVFVCANGIPKRIFKKE